VIGSLAEKSIFINRFWVYRFVRRHNEKLAVQRVKYPGKQRHEVSAEDLKVYFPSITGHLPSVPSEMFCNADETCVGYTEHILPPDVIVAS
jgi:hypothetical protein